MKPLISIIVPVYNVRPYLREALNSAICQTYQNLEIILVDDGSTDGSGDICDEYASDPRVSVIHQENHGLSGARNAGLNRMTGDYVAFLDPDDALHPKMIATLFDTLLQKEADIAACSCIVYRTEGPMQETEPVKIKGVMNECVITAREALCYLLEKRYLCAVWNKLYRRELWDELRFTEGSVYEDLLVLPSLLEKHPWIAVIPQSLVFHRIREGSITQTRSAKNVRDHINAHRVLRSYSEGLHPPLPSDILRLLYRENRLRALIFRWANLHKAGICIEKADGTDELKEEIQFLAQRTEMKHFKTKAAWFLFCFSPWLLLPAQQLFLHIRQKVSARNH